MLRNKDHQATVNFRTHIIGVKFVWICCFASLFSYLSPCSAHADKTIPVSEALQVIESLEKRIDNVQWKVNAVYGKLTDINDFNSMIPNKQSESSFVIMEPRSGRCKIEIKSIAPWEKGLDSHLAAHNMWSFDGEQARRFERTKPGQSLPGNQDPPGHGAIQTEIDSDMQNFILGAGLMCFPPYFRGVRFSELIREQMAKNTVNVVSNENGILRFSISEENGMMWSIDYDTLKGGVISDAIWGGAGKKLVVKHLNIRLQKIGDFWCPEEVVIVQPISKPPDIFRLTYSDVKFNQPVNREIFQIEFPKYTGVTDYINKKFYRVGGGFIDDRDATLKFMEREGLKQSDAAKSIQPKSSRNLILLACSVVLLVIIVIILIMRTYYKKRTIISLLAIVILSTSHASSAPPKTREDKKHSMPPVKISQCGFNVTIFALEYYEIKYDITHVIEALPVTEEGISLDRVRQVCEAYGLQTFPRKNVSLNDMPKCLDEETLAIIPVKWPGRELNHYIIALRHFKRGLLFVDVPVNCISYDDAKRLGLEIVNNVVVLVKSGKQISNLQGEQLELVPSSLDLGRFSISDKDASTPVKKIDSTGEELR